MADASDDLDHVDDAEWAAAEAAADAAALASEELERPTACVAAGCGHVAAAPAALLGHLQQRHDCDLLGYVREHGRAGCGVVCVCGWVGDRV